MERQYNKNEEGQLLPSSPDYDRILFVRA
jgi:hypothetical protein